MKHLKISEQDSIPVEFLSLRNVFYGGSGSGKTACGRVICEEAIKAGIPFGVIDLKADWWGLKSSADGKRDGIPVVVFGGEHADVPIHENGGAELAEIVVELRQPFIVDLEQFSKGKQLKFLAPFFDRLYDKNRLPLKLICDEADRYIPQRIISRDPNAAICLGAGEDIAKRGRKHGIFATFISQRNADLNKSVTELCDVAVVFRTSGPNDQKAVDDWFNAKGSLVTEAERAEVMQGIAGQPTGCAYFCCAHPHLKLFKKIQMRLPETFDSSATPEIGKEIIQPKKFARIELEQLGERMRATIEQAKANDPGVLKRRIAELEKQIFHQETKAKSVEPEVQVKEIPMFPDITRAQLKQIIEEFESLLAWSPVIEKIKEQFEKYTVNTGKNKNQWAQLPPGMKQPDGYVPPKHFTTLPQRNGTAGAALAPKAFVKRVVPAPAIHRPVSPVSNESNGTLGKCERAILTALAQYPQGRSAVQIALLAQYSVNSGGFNNSLGKLRSAGFITRGHPIQITAPGIEVLGEFEPLPTGRDLAEYWIGSLGKCEAAILRHLVDLHPNYQTSEEVAAATGYSRDSGGFNNSLGRLRTLELITRGQPMKASDEFFQ